MTLAVSTVGYGRFTITHLTRMVSSTLPSGGNAHSGRIFSIGSLPCIALLPLLPFADLHLNPPKFSSDSFNASSKPGLATPGLHHPSNHLKKMTISERSSKPGLATPGRDGDASVLVRNHRAKQRSDNLSRKLNSTRGEIHRRATGAEPDLPLHRSVVPHVRVTQLRFGHRGFGFYGGDPPKFDLHGMRAAVEKYRATTLILVPPILVAMINGSDLIKAKYDLTSLKTVRSGGAPLSKEITECFLEKYPTVDIFQGYAWTESNSSGASTDSVNESKRHGPVGLLSSGVVARIVDPDTGRIMGVNQTGELWLKGPAITKGYFRNEEATKETINSEGWLKTGDLCCIDDEGFVFILDRLKELIKYKAYQAPPAELEGLLLTHPEIIDAAVIPFPDREVGQLPMAYVVRKTGSLLSEKSLMEFVAKQVAPYKRVRKVAFVSSIPKNPSGKILRKDLIKLATSNSTV
ncbi:hypothetical protein F2Q70_00040261 [Brassica cretica]|uniref:Uncharacterized protein n=1 Tax=Brassica cretica TaxID=69181 RepID=A0A8S9K7H8_BRACR|nr:hypothetical protein F2Q70_00040261 [Brassica cretica]